MSSSEVSLLQIPEIPMEHILEYLNFPSILILRKVCHDLRNFIDDSKPASRLTKIRINVCPEFIQFSLDSRTQSKIRIFYEKCNEGSCLIKKYYRNAETMRTILGSEDFVAVFRKDFDNILRHQKTILEEFIIKFDSLSSTIKERIVEIVSTALKSMNHLLQVKSLYMGLNNHNEVLAVLPYIDSKPLETIHIEESSRKDNTLLNLDEIRQLEQWKQAENLTLHEFQITNLVEDLKHFSSINLGYREISIEELILLKELFISSSTLTTIKVYIDSQCSAVVGLKLIERFGEPLVDTNQDRSWFFRIPETIQFLRITHKSYKINFNRIEQSDVPQIALISN